MVQTVLVVEDAHVDDWRNEQGQAVTLAASLVVVEDDPNPPADDTFIVSGNLPAGDVYVAKFQDFVNPEDLGENWVLKFRAQKMINDGTMLDLTVQLRQNYVDEIDQGELLHEELFEGIAFGFADYEMVMTVPDALIPDNPPDPDIDPPTIDASELYVRLIADTS